MRKAIRVLPIAVAALFLFSAAPVEAQDTQAPGIYNPTDSTPVTMYFHVIGLQNMPVNTQKPRDDYVSSVSVGLATHSGCLADPTGNTHVTDKSYHTWYGYSSPGYVQYDVDEGGQPRYHPERGISFDVELDSSQDIRLKWYLSTQITSTDNLPANPNTVANPVPNVILRATVRQGDDISVGNALLNVGEIIGQKQTEPAHLAGENTQSPDGAVKYMGQEGDLHVYEFSLNVPIQTAEIDKDESYNVRVDAFMDNPHCDDPGADGGDYIMADWVRLYTSPKYRPQMTWNVFNPLRIEYLHPQFIGDDLVVHTSTNSPWGNYDVRGDQPSESAGGLEVEIQGPSQALSFNRVALTARTHEHDHHTEAVDATWVWEYKKDNAQKGLYTVVFKAKNDQETASATAVAQFEIGSGKIVGCGNQATGTQASCEEGVQKDGAAAGEDAPGIGMVLLIGTLALLGVAARRRK